MAEFRKFGKTVRVTLTKDEADRTALLADRQDPQEVVSFLRILGDGLRLAPTGRSFTTGL